MFSSMLDAINDACFAKEEDSAFNSAAQRSPLSDIKELVVCRIADAAPTLTTFFDQAADTVRNTIQSVFRNSQKKRRTDKHAVFSQKYMEQGRPLSNVDSNRQDDGRKRDRSMSSFAPPDTIVETDYSVKTEEKTKKNKQCREWLSSVEKHCGMSPKVKKSNSLSVHLHQYHRPQQKRQSRQFVKAHSDLSKLLCEHRSEFTPLQFLQEASLVDTYDDGDDCKFLRSISKDDQIDNKYSTKGTLLPKHSEETKELCRSTMMPDTFTSAVPTKFEVEDTLIENKKQSGHVIPRNPSQTSQISMNQFSDSYAVDILKTNSALSLHCKDEPVGGYLNVSLQFLIMSKRLKISIESVDNIRNDKENSRPKAYFIKVSFVNLPKYVGKTKQTKIYTGLNALAIEEQIYVKHVTLESAHEMTVEFKMYRRKSRCGLRRYENVGETRISLENLDVVGSVNLCKPLHLSKK